MADKKIIAIEIKVVDKAKKSIDSVAESTKNLSSKVTILNKEQREQIINDEKSAIQKKNLIASLKAQAAAEMNTANATSHLRAQSGLNNAILLETSRLASDAAYGMQGMANNIGQLLSLFQSYSRTAGGFMASIKELGKSLMGAGGLLIAAQLLISFLPKIIKYFERTKEVIESETEALIKNNKELDKTIAKRRILSELAEESIDVLSETFAKNILNGNLYLDDTDAALKEIAENFKNIGVENSQLIEDETIANDARLQIAYELLSIYNKESEIDKLRQKANLELLNAKKEGREVDQTFIQQQQLDIIQVRKEIKKLLEDIERLKKRGVILTPEEDDGGEKRFKKQFLFFTEEIFRARKIIRDTLVKDREDQLYQTGEIEKEKLRVERDSFIERQQQRLKDGLITNEQYKATEIQAAEELQTALVSINNKTQTLIAEYRVQQQTEANKISLENLYEKFRLELELELQFEQNLGIRAGKRIELDQLILNSRIRSAKEALDNDRLTILERERLQSQLTKLEQQEANIRIKIADAEFNAKRELLDQTANALMAFSQLVQEQTRAGKALAVASTLISTYSTAQKAYESQFLPFPTADSPVRGTIAAAAAVAAGLARVNSILKVNENGETSTKSSKTTVSAPDFNVVGASPESQLAQTVASQQQKPLKAFVVGKEITNHQELERNILTTAGLGN